MLWCDRDWDSPRTSSLCLPWVGGFWRHPAPSDTSPCGWKLSSLGSIPTHENFWWWLDPGPDSTRMVPCRPGCPILYRFVGGLLPDEGLPLAAPPISLVAVKQWRSGGKVYRWSHRWLLLPWLIDFPLADTTEGAWCLCHVGIGQHLINSLSKQYGWWEGGVWVLGGSGPRGTVMQGLGSWWPGWGVLTQENMDEGSGQEVPDHGRGDPTLLGAMVWQEWRAITDHKSRREIWWCFDVF